MSNLIQTLFEKPKWKKKCEHSWTYLNYVMSNGFNGVNFEINRSRWGTATGRTCSKCGETQNGIFIL